MMIHPPMLYSGYVAFTIPFAFAIGALITRRLDASWIRATRRFALIAWAFLGFGLLLGARWSYTELGWGGYWAWDPVENAALMPWLMGTAFLHSIMVQEKRGMLKVWNACLIVATFSLALLGTFLVRSGVLQSIHAFGDSTVGPYILGLIAVVLIGSTALIVSRLDDLRSEKRIDSLASREAVFVVNNLLLVALCATIFWGTFFPLISELFTGTKSSLAAPWFDRYTTPLAILLVLFTGIGPLLAWRRVSWDTAKRVFLVPSLVAAAMGVALALFSDAAHKPWAFALFVFATFALVGLAQEFWRGASARRSLKGGSMAVGAGRRRLAQPAPLRRLHRPHRHRGAADRDRRLLELPDQPRRRPQAGRKRRDRRLQGHLQASDRQRRPPCLHRRGGTAGGEGRQGVHPAPRPPLLPADRATSWATISNYFGGESDSDIGLKAGVLRDFWTAIQPSITGVQAGARAADKGFEACVRGAPGDAAAMRSGGGDDAGGRRQPAPDAGRPGSDRKPAGGDGQADRHALRRRRRARRPSA